METKTGIAPEGTSEDDVNVDWCGNVLTYWDGEVCCHCGRVWGLGNPEV